MAVLMVDAAAPARDLDWRPAAGKAVASLCEEAVGRWPERFPARSAAIVGMGRSLSSANPGQRREWQRIAADVCRQVAVVDPDWFCRFWRAVVRGGVRPPAEVTQILVGLDFLRPSGRH